MPQVEEAMSALFDSDLSNGDSSDGYMSVGSFMLGRGSSVNWVGETSSRSREEGEGGRGGGQGE